MYQSYIATSSVPYGEEVSIFDSDSHQIGVDSHSLYSISNNLDHFISNPKPCKVDIVSINGKIQVPGIGTIV